jgi:hypothetical protein
MNWETIKEKQVQTPKGRSITVKRIRKQGESTLDLVCINKDKDHVAIPMEVIAEIQQALAEVSA